MTRRTSAPRAIRADARIVRLAVLASALASWPALAAEYTVTDLGTLGGALGSTSGINESGEVAGTSDIGNLSRAFLYTGGQMKPLGALGGPESWSWAYAVNFYGQVVGVSILWPENLHRGFLYSNGTMIEIGSLGGTETDLTSANGINAGGQVVGDSTNVDFKLRAFFYSGGVMTDLGTLPGGDASIARAINDARQIAGFSETGTGYSHAFLYSAGTMTDLGTLGGARSYAWGINALGQAVGEAETSDGQFHAFLYSAGTMIDLGTLGGLDSSANAINAAGHVVGWSDTPNVGRHAFIYRDGTMTDLNDLVPAGVVVRDATGINSAGQIAATGMVNGGSSKHALLLAPKLLSRFAYAWANLPTTASYTPAAQYAYNSAGGAIHVTRQSVGVYDVSFDSLPGWGNNGLSSAVAVSAYGSSTIACSVASYASSSRSAVATVACFDVVAKLSADSRFTILVAGNESVPRRSAFALAGGSAPVPPPNPAWSWTSGPNPISITHNADPGDYNVFLGTGAAAKSAKLVTGAGGATRCNQAGNISGGLRVRCYNVAGTGADERFWIVQVGGGLANRRIGFAFANQPTSASYTPSASRSFNSSGGAITATRSSVGRYAIDFAGLQKLPGHTEHVQVTSFGMALSICNVVNWGNSSNGLRVRIECRDGAGQFKDSRYNVLVIE